MNSKILKGIVGVFRVVTTGALTLKELWKISKLILGREIKLRNLIVDFAKMRTMPLMLVLNIRP